MYWLSCNTGDWIEGSCTEVKVGFTDEAKAEADKWNCPGSLMIERCFWRLMYERQEKISGSEVRFEVDLAEVKDLIYRLGESNSASPS